VVDALSRRDASEDGQSVVVSALVFAVFDELRAETATMASLQQMKEEVLAGRKGDEWRLLMGSSRCVARSMWLLIRLACRQY
jgi:hypothetical protein